jgi:NAD(P)-dependent dehydrogenase (short-subunit alcohol dehydrogenase family)
MKGKTLIVTGALGALGKVVAQEAAARAAHASAASTMPFRTRGLRPTES